MTQRLLVTGGSGFIGSNFVRFVLQHRPDCTVHNLDNLSYSGNPENLSDIDSDPRYTFTHGDINNRELVDSLMGQCDAVVHFAAESHVDRSILDSRPYANFYQQTLTTMTRLRVMGGRLHGRPSGRHVFDIQKRGPRPPD